MGKRGTDVYTNQKEGYVGPEGILNVVAPYILLFYLKPTHLLLSCFP
jgi:hypothetical protein